MAQLNLRSIHRSQLVNVSKRGGGKICAVGTKIEAIYQFTKSAYPLSLTDATDHQPRE